MIALREIHKVENGRVTIHLPADFPAEQVEVIVLLARSASSALQKTVEPQLDNDDFDAPLSEEILALFDGSQTDQYGMSIQG